MGAAQEMTMDKCNGETHTKLWFNGCDFCPKCGEEVGVRPGGDRISGGRSLTPDDAVATLGVHSKWETVDRMHCELPISWHLEHGDDSPEFRKYLLADIKQLARSMAWMANRRGLQVDPLSIAVLWSETKRGSIVSTYLVLKANVGSPSKERAG